MAVWTYHPDGRSELIEAQYLDGQLAAGWSVTEPGTEVEEEATEVEKPE